MKMNFLDCIDFDRVNALLEGFNQSTGFVTAILDIEGNVLSKSGWRTICTEFHRKNPESVMNCITSDTILANKVVQGDKYHFYKCMNGLVDVAVPIIIKGEHVANLFSGQFFMEVPDLNFFMDQAKRYGFDEKVYINALNKVPIVTREEVVTKMNFLINLTQVIVDLTIEKFELISLNEAKIKSEIAFRESENRYINLFQNNYSVQLIIDIDSGEIVDVNESACQYYGFTKEEFKDKKVWDINPSNILLIKEKLNQSYEHGTYLVITKHRRSDGEIRDVEVFNGRAEINGRKLVHAIVHDITEKKKVEKALQESHQRIEKVLKNEVVGVMFWDVTIGLMIDANDSFLKLMGYSRQDLDSRELTWQKLTPPEYYELSISEMEKYKVTGHIGPYEKEYLCKDGSRKWLLFAGNALEDNMAIEFCVDISEKKIAQNEAYRHSQRTEALLRITSLLNSELQIDKVYHTICYEACTSLRAKLSAYLSFDSKNQSFHLTASVGLSDEISMVLSHLKWESFDNFIQHNGKVSAISDLTSVQNVVFIQKLYNEGVKNIAYSTVERDGQLLGVLIVGNLLELDLTTDFLTFLSGLTNHAASAVTNARLFKETNDRLSQLRALRIIDLAIMESLDLQAVFKVILDEVIKTLHVDAAAILHLDQQTNTLKYEHWTGFRNITSNKIVVPMGYGYAGRTASEQKSIDIRDINEVDKDALLPFFILDEGFVSYNSAPLISNGNILGVLEVFNREPFECETEWLSFFNALAGQAAIAINSAELFLKLENSNLNLLNAYDATIEGWAYALDLKDEETELHSRRVTDLTLNIAQKMGVEESKLIQIRRGALLHDIGKMGIPDSILLKPGKLTDEEWVIMQKHPSYAFEMISNIVYLHESLDIPYCHHEKWDGSGYPRGLKGEQIPLAARIFAIVDVYDALTSNRPYREAWPRERVLKYIKEQSGTHFDPRIVDIFINQTQ